VTNLDLHIEYHFYPEEWSIFGIPKEAPVGKAEILALARKLLHHPQTPKIIPITNNKFTFSVEGYFEYVPEIF
jgi:hypothetical protein